jgi:hypothetical protein
VEGASLSHLLPPRVGLRSEVFRRNSETPRHFYPAVPTKKQLSINLGYIRHRSFNRT